MANPPRTRKRVDALRRASDGSAFQRCDLCGVSVAIAIYDMHNCKLPKQRGKKRPKFDQNDTQKLQEPAVCDQPRSPFCFFMEAFKNANKSEDSLTVGRKGFEQWKLMSAEERQCFIIQAERVNSAYEQALLQEIEDESMVDQEADSASVGKIYQSYYGEYMEWAEQQNKYGVYNDWDDWEISDSFV